jgi:hypothetical protein
MLISHRFVLKLDTQTTLVAKWQKKTFHFKGHSLEIVFSWGVVMSYTPQHWPIFCTKLVFGGVVYRTIVHYSFTQSGDPIQNYFLSSAFSEATITGSMTFPTPPTCPPGWGFYFSGLMVGPFLLFIVLPLRWG